MSHSGKGTVMTIKAVTTAQLESIRKMCADKGVGKDMLQQYGLDGLALIVHALDAIKTVATPNMVRYATHLEPWLKFYRDVMNIAVNVDTIRIPERVAGFDRLIVMMPGMTPERLFQICKSRFGSWKWTNDDLDKIVTSDRTAADGPYAIWVRDRVEADEELANKSYNDLKAGNILGVTFEERLLDELKYHFRTGSHKDIQNVTLCSGSRYSDGNIPGVGWRGYYDGLGVSRRHVGYRSLGLRSRQAVS